MKKFLISATLILFALTSDCLTAFAVENRPTALPAQMRAFQAGVAEIYEGDLDYFPEFASLGPMYRVIDPFGHALPFVISSPSPSKMNQTEAPGYCSQYSGRIPTSHQFETIARAQGKGTSRGYVPLSNINRNFSGMLWTSESFTGFQTETGFIDRHSLSPSSELRVICVHF